MPENNDSPTTAFELAIRHKVNYWPGKCPWCGYSIQDDVKLEQHPGLFGEALYRCSRCEHTTAKSPGAVAKVIERIR